MKTEREGERNWNQERKRREALGSSRFCYFNPDSALKYGHHVDPFRKFGSAISLANRRRCSGLRGGTVGGSWSVECEGSIKVCEQRRVGAQRPHLQESWTIHRPMETGLGYCLISLNSPAFISCLSSWFQSCGKHLLRRTALLMQLDGILCIWSKSQTIYSFSELQDSEQMCRSGKKQTPLLVTAVAFSICNFP